MRLTSELTDLLMFLDSEADSMSQAMHMAAARCREAATEAEASGLIPLERLFTESAESWTSKADRLLALAEHIPDALDY